MISVRKLQISRGSSRLPEISFEIPQGEYAVLMGPTGCGKTSLLECIVGLVKQDSGEIIIAEKEVTQLPAAARHIGYVPQDAALFAGLSVRENIGFALSIRGIKEITIQERVEELAASMEISNLLDRGIRGLSGGERQRIALCRAMALRPRVMLLDEPLSSLDEISREKMCNLLGKIHCESGATFLHVTHSSAEATRLASMRLERILV
ncbi:MAG: ATP-binding cassette domain-containing protein [Akkermansiaceae bacterium]|nr:ATP-binding cassette domain-containing protein [Akkermansiaceae bacterium]NJR43028.1 ATP-binding cassette domain-containing protein [Akkermansiaceae bacterium]